MPKCLENGLLRDKKWVINWSRMCFSKNHPTPIGVLHIQPKFWWMLPMGVRDNHTQYEPEAQWWVLQVTDLHYKICNLGPKSAFFRPKAP